MKIYKMIGKGVYKGVSSLVMEESKAKALASIRRDIIDDDADFDIQLVRFGNDNRYFMLASWDEATNEMSICKSYEEEKNG